MRKAALVVAFAVLAVLCGCEENYVTSAPDGTVMFVHEENLYRWDGGEEAVLVAENVRRADFSPEGERLLCLMERQVAAAGEEASEGKSAAREGTPAGKEGEAAGKEGEPAAEARWQLLVIDREGALESVIVEEVEDADWLLSLDWSPDGKYVSFVTRSEESEDALDLHVREVGGAFTAKIENVSAGYAWAPDSTEIAVLSAAFEASEGLAPGTLQVWNVPEEELLAEPAAVFFSPWCWVGWARGGEEILFASNPLELPQALPDGGSDQEEMDLGLYAVGRGGQGLRRVLPEAGLGKGLIGLFDVSPDGSRVVYVRVHDVERGIGGDVCLAPVDGGEVRTLVENAEIGGVPQFLSKGRIACAVKPGDGQMRLLVFEEDGSKVDLLELLGEAAGAEAEE